MVKNEKTNVMRLLDSKKIKYAGISYAEAGCIAGMDVAAVLNEDPGKVFKTLVTVGNSGKHFVFVVPVNCDLNLKKAAMAVGEKNIAMIKLKELLPLTGYVHGGCSPIGMKKQFRTVIDVSAEQYDTIFFSAGKIGYQVEIDFRNINSLCPYELADISDYIDVAET